MERQLNMGTKLINLENIRLSSQDLAHSGLKIFLGEISE